MELRAVVDKVLEPVTGNGKNGPWKKQSVIVSYQSGKYTNILELTNMRNADDFGRLRVGAEYVFHFDVTSRLYNERYYTSCTCYKWDAVQGQQAEQAPASNQGGFNIPQQPQPQQGEQDDLPF